MNPIVQYSRYAQRRIEAELLPNTCTIETAGTPTETSTGVWSFSSVQVLYNNSPNIPCRLDSSRSFRAEKFKTQEAVVNEFVFYYPKSLHIKPNDKIKINVDNRLRVFEVTKLIDASIWRPVNSALINEVVTQV